MNYHSAPSEHNESGYRHSQIWTAVVDFPMTSTQISTYVFMYTYIYRWIINKHSLRDHRCRKSRLSIKPVWWNCTYIYRQVIQHFFIQLPNKQTILCFATKLRLRLTFYSRLYMYFRSFHISYEACRSSTCALLFRNFNRL